jgi:dihydroorotate dehydrogenase
MKTFPEILARADKVVRPLMVKMPSKAVVAMYSASRKQFLTKVAQDFPHTNYNPPEELARTLWGIRFRSPIFNAAGMFKNGDGYPLVARQGAGAYLAGTTTGSPRKGNKKHRIFQPFTPYPRSKAASNWLGLPNDGHGVVAERLSELIRINSCPIGASVSASPEEHERVALVELTEGMRLYDKAGVDFIELNESCPNVPNHSATSAVMLDDALVRRCENVFHTFLQKRKRRLPVIVKFSNDTHIGMIPLLLDLLLTLGFDGVNFGNTSTSYKRHESHIHPSEKKLYNYFTSTFGGGLSGKPLVSSSLSLCTAAMDYLRAHPAKHEFHVVRTGGIESPNDVIASEKAGISLNQWYTGYFENFAEFGNELYEKFYADLIALPSNIV